MARTETGGQPGSTHERGAAAERLACDYLRAQGLRLLQANYRTPGRGGGEIDLVMADRDGTLVFVEVRKRRQDAQGGAGASIGALKQRRIVLAARHYLMRTGSRAPCRFDAVLLDGEPIRITWLRGAFEAG
ncbi:YraN family protein [Comamonas sp. BIGb0124]|uniref:YraN family protein n=1 Tax=Comamonas sp. BIGb0124 TaxID=2485130 RepID=UPI001F3FBD1A|nr:YraN family protein [Comamonas sp. BIGb0124]